VLGKLTTSYDVARSGVVQEGGKRNLGEESLSNCAEWARQFAVLNCIYKDNFFPRFLLLCQKLELVY
jgi:hypothetical protein